MSDYYIEKPLEPTPWSRNWCMAAQLSYYFVLNWNRATTVIKRAEDIGFFDGLNTFLDWGAGLGALTIPLAEKLKTGSAVEISSQPVEVLNRWLSQVKTSPALSKNTVKKTSLVSFSYSLTEIESIPPEVLESEALLIIEPSTGADSRRLLQWRSDLQKKGFYAWAPCTHQEACPILTKSKKDWCHDRSETVAPDWFWEIEKHLPIKNKTVTFSYLAMRKSKPSYESTAARLVGDMRKEKGKHRIAVCRGSEREFLSWLKKDRKKPPPLKRGQKIHIPQETEKKGNELRLKDENFF